MKLEGRNDNHVFDYSKVSENVFIGSDLCQAGVCLLHGEEFKSLEVSIELNLSAEANEVPPKEVESYIWLPVDDGQAPTESQLNLGSAIIKEAVDNGKKVYVHCKNGHGRSPTMVAAYLIRFEKLSLEAALNLIKEKRPESHIEEIQIKALGEFSNKWK